jgi:hypothetical protein
MPAARDARRPRARVSAAAKELAAARCKGGAAPLRRASGRSQVEAQVRAAIPPVRATGRAGAPGGELVLLAREPPPAADVTWRVSWQAGRSLLREQPQRLRRRLGAPKGRGRGRLSPQPHVCAAAEARRLRL